MRLSPSSLDLAHRCRRQWAYRYLGPAVPYVLDFSRALGTGIHACLEGFPQGRSVYQTPWESLPDWPQIVRALPAEKVDLIKSEAPKRALPVLGFLAGARAHGQGSASWLIGESPVTVDFSQVGGHGFEITPKCRIDLKTGFVDQPTRITDYKSTRGGQPRDESGHVVGPFDPWLWAKTEADLRGDVQCLIYSLATMIQGRCSEVECQWIYTLTDLHHAPKAKEVRFRLGWDEAITSVQTWFDLGRELQEIERAVRGGQAIPDVPCSPEACSGFGGCPYHVGKGGPCNPHGSIASLVMSGVSFKPATPEKVEVEPMDQTAKLSEMCLVQPNLFAMLPQEQQVVITAYRAAQTAPAPAPDYGYLPPPPPAAYANPPAAVPPPPAGAAPGPAKRGRPPKAPAAVAAPTAPGITRPAPAAPVRTAEDVASREAVEPALTLGDVVRAVRALVAVAEKTGLM